MTFKKLSKKQREVFRWCYKNDSFALICDGSVRSGKTASMTCSFVLWAMKNFRGENFAFCGNTVSAVERNIIAPLLQMTDLSHYFRIHYTGSRHILTVSTSKFDNYFYIFGGKDEGSYKPIQGVTLAGILFDEVALMPESFVNQAIARTLSVTDARLWFNCNPDSPEHWFYKNWILKSAEKNALHLHFTMGDNPIMTPEKIKKTEMLYSGVFYDRYIRGLWVLAEGLIYPMYNNTVETVDRNYTEYYISMDYGIQNPTAIILWGYFSGAWYAIREYYHSGRETGEQKTDLQYYEELEKICGDLPVRKLIIDPSATSFIALCCQKKRFKIFKANNEVIAGIQRVAQCITERKILFNDCCRRGIAEFFLYSWDKTAVKDTPVKQNDHFCDAVRYFVSTAGIWRKKADYKPVIFR